MTEAAAEAEAAAGPGGDAAGPVPAAVDGSDGTGTGAMPSRSPKTATEPATPTPPPPPPSTPHPDPTPVAFATTPRRLRTALHHHAKGVAVITVAGTEPAGFAATSLAPVSFDPPLLSFSIAKESSSWPRLAVADHAMVHLLADDQEELAHRFGTRGAARFGPATRWRLGAHGLPVLDDALAWLELAVLERIEVDGHAVVIGRVVAVRESGTAGKGPLLHYSGHYGQLAPHPHHCGCPVG